MQVRPELRSPVAAARLVRRRVEGAVRSLRDRVRFALPPENEWLGALGGRFGTVDEALGALARDGAARLFPGDLDRAAAADLFARHHPERRDRILRAAERIGEHVFDLLGSGERRLGAHLPWHTDFKTGRHWDRSAHAAGLSTRFEDRRDAGGDVRVPWTLSRFHHLVRLGQAFWLGGDRRHYDEFRAQILDWLRENRPGFGINWASATEAGIRAANWIWALWLFRPETLADREFASLLLRALFAHGRFLAARLLDGASGPADRGLGGLVGLLFLGVLFRGAPEADVWKGRAIGAIARACEPGDDHAARAREISVGALHLRAEMLLAALLVARRSGLELPSLESEAGRIAEFVAHCLKPDGRAPRIGDEDGGRFVILGEPDADPRDHRHVLALAGRAFGDEALISLAGGRWEDAYWWFGREAAPRPGGPPGRPRAVVTSRIPPRPGLLILRHDDLYAALVAAARPADAEAPAHDDALSVEIQAAGEDLIVDPGAAAGDADPALRDRFGSTAAHNTVRVDGEDFLAPAEAREGPAGRVSTSVLRTVSRPGFDLVEAEHRGYARLPEPVRHRRLLLLNKRGRRVTIEDSLVGPGRHRLEWSFHLAPRCEAGLDEEDGIPLARCRIGAVSFVLRPELLPAEGLRAWLVADLVSPACGRTEPALTVRFEWVGRLPVVARFTLAPGGCAAGPPGAAGR